MARPHLSSPQLQGLRDHEFLLDVLEGLSKPQKEVPCKYFYDANGSLLFDAICRTSAYYPTRTELRILRDNMPHICAAIGPHAALIELGSGSSLKTSLLLDALEDLRVYVPIDISGELLEASADRLRSAYPGIPIAAVHADYTKPLKLPKQARWNARKVIYFPGSTIGNLSQEEAQQFLQILAGTAGPDGALLIGVDLVKAPRVLERAYNDEEGVTAAFNLNLLHRINGELRGEFPVDRFRHLARWNPVQSRIEMHLVSLDTRRVRIAHEYEVSLRRGETIWTESSHKYTIESFHALASRAGWRSARVWTDPEQLFSLHYCQVWR